ncbi:MAG TPA: hypothetical protein IAB21_02440 [Candidatus Avelusimicrobium excrementipullorum]|nr:hypothetical protein [Candidatus Avelusimicrobium excrementipullorum]
MRPVTEQQKTLSSLALGGFFFIVKTLTAALLVLLAVLVVSQSAVAPVSTRLLGMYAVQYTVQTVKPYRHLFPRPYMVPEEGEEQILQEQTR